MDPRFKENKVCVVVPTYNNHRTLPRVLDGILQYTTNVIVVNDGSTDATPTILQQYQLIEGFEIIHLEKNRGKGIALRKAFQLAVSMGYGFAITIDSDGQHYASDLGLFLDDMLQNGPALIVGDRNMAQTGIPTKSSFGNRFSNFWYRVETGISMSDTQSGFRLYPIKELAPIRFFTSRFEFEIEVLVKAAWRDIVVRNIPIKVLYDPSERVSHFRPFRDFTRISILNTYLVFLTFMFIRPRNWFRKLIR